MGIISTIKSVLGLSEPDRPGEEANVTIEREPDATSERAVKETDPVEPVDEDVETEDGPAETEDADEEMAEETEEDEETSEPSDESTGEPVENVKGIGPAYAGRLEQAGVGTVEELANADAAELASATDISENRIANWIDRAKAR